MAPMTFGCSTIPVIGRELSPGRIVKFWIVLLPTTVDVPFFSVERINVTLPYSSLAGAQVMVNATMREEWDVIPFRS